MKAEVEPLPLVPAMWMAFRRLKSEGWDRKGGQLGVWGEGCAEEGGGGEEQGGAHLVPYSAAPFDHFWDGLLVHAASGLADGIDDGGVGLEGVECLDGILSPLAVISGQDQR